MIAMVCTAVLNQSGHSKVAKGDFSKEFNQFTQNKLDLNNGDLKDVFDMNKINQFTQSVDQNKLADEDENKRNLSKLRDDNNFKAINNADVQSKEIQKEEWIKNSVVKHDLSNKNDKEIIAQTYTDCETINIPAKYSVIKEKCKEGVDVKIHKYIENFKVDIEEDPPVEKTFNLTMEKNNFWKWESIFVAEPASGKVFTRGLAISGDVDIQASQRSINVRKRLAINKILQFLRENAVNTAGIESLNVTGSDETFSYDEYHNWANYNTKDKRVPKNITISVKFKPGTKKIKRKYWTNHRAPTEKNVESGLCEYVKMECLEGPEERNIEGVKVQSDCWKKKYTYQCKGDSTDTCSSLRKKGCYLTEAKCTKSLNDSCLDWEKEYNCPGKIITPAKTEVRCSGDKMKPFCLGGDCHNVNDTPNNEFGEAMSKFSVFSEIAKDMKKSGSDIEIFKGSSKRCARRPFDFVDCCGCSGWGKSLGLSACNDEEKELRQLRKKGLCHYVGSHCTEKFLGKCVKKESTYVCFKSKIALKIHELSRMELGIGWGDSESPITRGLSATELSSVNMDKVDFSDLYDDVSIKSNISGGSKGSQDIKSSLNSFNKSGDAVKNGIKMEVLNAN